MSKDVRPTRLEVIDEYNLRLRVQCSPCNISHKWEGIAGPYADSGIPGFILPEMYTP